ncbi:MAG: T9SS type A sorting domain-containing protein [Bacteroidetes bacterium]|nr:T9SS type A sorting domain-containing protein [Bacteroidota bacterium]
MRKLCILLCFITLGIGTSRGAEDSVYVTANGDYVTVWNTGVHANCASLFLMATRLSHDTLYVDETDTTTVRARCACTFDLSVSTSGIPFGAYVAVVQRIFRKEYAYPVDTIAQIGSAPFAVGVAAVEPLPRTQYQSTCYHVLDVSDQAPLPGGFALQQNYPNPFNPETTIRYVLPAAVHVDLVVYDLLGRKVSVLESRTIEAGPHEVRFSAVSLAAGVYVYRIGAGEYSAARMMHLVR